MLNNNHIVQDNATMIPSTDASSSSLVSEDRSFAHPDASSDIPHDQLRMIENINSLISEVVILILSFHHHLKLKTCHGSHDTSISCYLINIKPIKLILKLTVGIGERRASRSAEN